MIEPATLDRIEMFRGLNAPAKQALARGATLTTFNAQAVLFTAGSAARGLFVILEGHVRVLRMSEDRQHVVHAEGPGGTLGEVPLFDGGGYPATAIALQRVLCVVFTRDALAAAVTADTSLAWVFLNRLSGRVRGLVQRLDRLAAHHVTARLAGLILERRGEAKGAFALGATQVEIAEELGTVREVVVRALRDLKRLGAIASSGRGKISVKNAELLRSLAG